jgi:hypothetical protein
MNESYCGCGENMKFHHILALMCLALCLAVTGAICDKAPRVGADDWSVMQLAYAPIKEVKGTAEFWDPGPSSAYDFLIYTPKEIGDYISFTIKIPVDGRYAPQTTCYSDGAGGIYQIEVDESETSFGPENDFYTKGVWQHGVYDVTAGTYTITYRLIGQNPKSKSPGVRLGNLHWRYHEHFTP